MDLGVVGLLLSLNNMAHFGGPELQLSDMSVVMDQVSSLKKTLLEYPGFNYEMFRHKSINRVGKTGIYASNNFRKYLFPDLPLSDVDGLVKPNDKGILIIFLYDTRTNVNYSNEDNSPLHILTLNEEEDPEISRAYLWHAAHAN